MIALLASANVYATMWVVVDSDPAKADPENLVYTTVQDAVNAVIDAQLEENICIFIKNGTYNESVFIGNKDTRPVIKVSLIGESKNGVIIESHNYFGLKGVHPSINPTDSVWFDRNTSAALYVNGPTDGTASFYAENITFKNFSGVGQAQQEANVIYVRDLDGFAFKNVNIQGYKAATEYKKGRRSMFYKCDISAADKLFKSGGTSMIYKCNLNVNADGASIVQPEDIVYGEPSGADTVMYGFMYRDCILTKHDTVHAASSYLAVPNAWNSSVVYLNCKMADHIAPVGWKLKDEHANRWSYFGEYNSMNLDGTPADVSQRGNGGIQIPESDVKNYLYLNRVFEMYNFYRNTGITFPAATRMFRADSMVVAPPAPTGVTATAGTVTWNAVNGASGYIVYRDGAFAGFAESNTFTDATPGTTYTVYSHNKFGAKSLPSGSTETEMTIEEMYNELYKKPGGTQILPVSGNKFAYSFSNGTFRTIEPCNFTVYNISGRCLKVVQNSQEVNLQGMSKGIYLIRSVDNANNSSISKVAL